DLADTPTTGIEVQLCGDAHLMNFGFFAAPDRRLVFDVNDFDETIPGPWEWDVKRLAASFVVAGQSAGYAAKDIRKAVLLVCSSYRERIRALTEMAELDVWYSRVEADEAIAAVHSAKLRTRAQRLTAKARSRDALRAVHKLTTVSDVGRRIVDKPP